MARNFNLHFIQTSLYISICVLLSASAAQLDTPVPSGTAMKGMDETFIGYMLNIFSVVGSDFVVCIGILAVGFLVFDTLRYTKGAMDVVGERGGQRGPDKKSCGVELNERRGGRRWHGETRKPIKEDVDDSMNAKKNAPASPQGLSQIVAFTISARIQPTKALSLYKELSAKRKHLNLSTDLADAGSQHTALEFYAALMQCAGQAGDTEYVLRLFEDMVEADIARPLSLYESAMRLLAVRKLFKQGVRLYELIDRDALKPTPVMLSCFVKFAAEMDDVDRAKFFFDKLCADDAPSVQASMTILRLYAKRSDWISSLVTFKQIQATSMTVDSVLMNVVLATGVASGELDAAKQLLSETTSFADVVTYNTIMKGLAHQGDIDAVLEVLNQMEGSGDKPNLITFNTAIDAAVRAMRTGEAWRLYDVMQKEYGLSPDKCTCSTLVKGLSDSATTERITVLLGLIDDVFEDCSSQLRQSLLSQSLDASIRINNPDLALRAFAKMLSHQVMRKGDFSHVHLAACWTSLSRLSKRHTDGYQTQKDAILLKPLLQHTMRAIEAEKLNARALATVAHGAASNKFGRTARRLFVAIAQAMKPQLSKFSAQELGNTAWAFAKADHSDASFFGALAEAVTIKLSEFKAQNLANTAWAYAKAGQLNASFSAALAEETKLKITSFNTQDLANTAWAFAKAGQFDVSLFAALSEAAKLKVHEFNAQGLSNTAWAFATAGRSDASLFSALAFATKKTLGEFNAQNLANMAWAFAKTGQCSASLFVALAEAVKLKVRDFNAQEISNTLWAFASAGQTDKSLFAVLAKAAQEKLSDFNAQGLANLAWAFAKTGQCDASLFIALPEAVKLKLSEFNAQDLANTSWAFAKSGQCDASLFDALLKAAKLKVHEFNAQESANVAWAFAKVGRYDAALLDNLVKSSHLPPL